MYKYIPVWSIVHPSTLEIPYPSNHKAYSSTRKRLPEKLPVATILRHASLQCPTILGHDPQFLMRKRRVQLRALSFHVQDVCHREEASKQGIQRGHHLGSGFQGSGFTMTHLIEISSNVLERPRCWFHEGLDSSESEAEALSKCT